MAEVTILRVEVNGGTGPTTSPNKLNTSVAAGAVAGTVASRKNSGDAIFDEYNLTGGSSRQSTKDGKTIARAMGRDKIKDAVFSRGNNRFYSAYGEGFRGRAKQAMAGSKELAVNSPITMKSVTATASTGAAVYGLYSQHKSIGYSLSGSSHAASKQQAKAQTAMTTVGVTAAVATGNPVIAGVLLATKAYQMAQSNRRILYGIRSQNMMYQINRENLVKNTVQRRF